MPALSRSNLNSDGENSMKHCPICNQDLSVDSFGICRRRRDGRNLYCKGCIRIKVKAGRRRLKEMKAAQMSLERKPMAMRLKETPLDKVRRAIESGARTWDEIRSQARVKADQFDDVMAELLLDRREIRYERRGEERFYFLAA